MASTGWPRGCAALAAVLLAGCDVTLPWSGGDLQDGPRDLVATADPLDIDAVVLRWTPTAGQDRYELQGRAGASGWQTINPWVPAEATSFVVRVDPTVPELTPLAFRLRAIVRGSPSRWSGEAPLVRGIRAPSALSAELGGYFPAYTGPATVTWTNASQVATAIQLERSRLDGAGNPTAWTPVADASLASGRHVDPLLEDGATYAYRVRVGVDGAWSGHREARTPAVALAAPWGLRAVVESGGVRLTWTNQSTTAEVVSVSRCLGGCAGSTVDLPPSSSTWLDVEVMPASPLMAYQVRAARPGMSLYAWSEVAQVEPFTLPGPPALAASALLLPESEYAARDAAGRFHLAQQIYETPRIHRATAAGHETYVIPGAYRLAEPGVVLDAQGAPHTVFLRWVTGPGGVAVGTDVVHAWWNGSAWLEEVVATDDVAQWVSNTSQAWFGLDGSGRPQVVYRRTELFPAQESLVHVARGGAGWAATQVATASVPDFSRWSATFAVAPDGSAHLAMIGQSVALSANLIVLCSRTPAGAWSDGIVPTGTFTFDGPWLVAGDGGDAAVAYFAGFPRSPDVEIVRMQGGAWSAPETAVARLSDGYQPSLGFVASSNLSRLALLAVRSDRVGVHVRDGTGWQGVDVGRASYVTGSLGLGPGGVWALFPGGSAAFGQPVPYSLFDEAR